MGRESLCCFFKSLRLASQTWKRKGFLAKPRGVCKSVPHALGAPPGTHSSRARRRAHSAWGLARLGLGRRGGLPAILTQSWVRGKIERGRSVGLLMDSGRT